MFDDVFNLSALTELVNLLFDVMHFFLLEGQRMVVRHDKAKVREADVGP